MIKEQDIMERPNSPTESIIDMYMCGCSFQSSNVWYNFCPFLGSSQANRRWPPVVRDNSLRNTDLRLGT
jgi:hypothetical protein